MVPPVVRRSIRFLAVIGDLEKFWMQTPKTKGKTSLPGQSATIIPSHGENSKKNNTPEEISRGADYNNQSAT
jgi:hypothetical protein